MFKVKRFKKKIFLGRSEKDIIPLKCEALCADSGTSCNGC